MFYSYNNCTDEVISEIAAVVELCKRYILGNLIGIYLHGSLAMGCFNPNRSDLDFIVVVKEKISQEIKIEIVKKLMSISLSPSPSEISFLTEKNLVRDGSTFQYDLHYSEYWRKKYERLVTQATAKIWNDESLEDVDLSAHIRVINERGITIFGKDKDKVFPKINDEDYIKAILYDFDDSFDGWTKKPEYYILNACRVLHFLENRYVTSKKEGGEWGIEVLQNRFGQLIEAALDVYTGKVSYLEFNSNTIKEFFEFMNNKLTENIKIWWH